MHAAAEELCPCLACGSSCLVEAGQALCFSLSVVTTDLALLTIALSKDKCNTTVCSMCFSGNCNPDERERKDSNKGSEAKGGGTIDKTT